MGSTPDTPAPVIVGFDGLGHGEPVEPAAALILSTLWDTHRESSPAPSRPTGLASPPAEVLGPAPVELTTAVSVSNALVAGQWHLSNAQGSDINLGSVWSQYTGAGVLVGVVDSGVQYTHPELAARYNASIDYDFLMGNADGANKLAGDSHGTAVAGVIAARNDGTGTTGVAYGATITSFRLISNQGVSNTAFRNALSSAVDVSNNSWGASSPFSIGASAAAAIEQGLQTGVSVNRRGLGTVFVFAAGNSGHLGDNANYSEILNSRFTIGVGASDANGVLASFSTPGAPVLVTAPGAAILTSDITGSGGYAWGNTATVNGTSFAAPIVSGVSALMLQANPNLGYRDVQEILAYSARKMDAGHDGWKYNGALNWNGGGLHANERYGFGLVDATAAVRLAESWLLAGDRSSGVFANETRVSLTSGTLNQSIESGSYEFSLTVGSGLRLQHAEVQLNLSHASINDLVIELISPNNTRSLLFSRPPVNGTYSPSWSFSTTHAWGETGVGDWTLRISDQTNPLATGLLSNWSLRLYGNSLGTNDHYIYTDEYSGYAGDGSRNTLSDAGGTDTLNASAVSTDLVLDLQPGTASTLDGESLTIADGTVIENAIGGVGNDRLDGNAVGNRLFGGRGHDTLDGRAGVDTLVGGHGNDDYLLDDLRELITEASSQGTDRVFTSLANVTLGANLEHLYLTGEANSQGTGNTISNLIEGNNGRNRLTGWAGNDTLNGNGGDDTLVGGVGNDTYIVQDAGDLITELANEGSDWVTVMSGGYALGQHIENLRLGGDDATDGTGNSLGNRLVGNGGSNTLYGLSGDDTLDGLVGADRLEGGMGNDTYWVDQGDDQVIELNGEGTDRIFSTAEDYTLVEHVEQLILSGSANIHGTGSSQNDQLTGNSGLNRLTGGEGHDTLDGRDGADTLIGGLGNDVYYLDVLGDIVWEEANEGTDQIISSLVAYTLADQVENMLLAGTANIRGTGNALDNHLVGNAGHNFLTGLDGNDRLDGKAGRDTLTGGLGDDLYYVDDLGDVVRERAGEGTDRVLSAVDNVTLGNHVENLLLTGSVAMTGTGNTLDNRLDGSALSNTLRGLDGHDTLDGRGGADALIGGRGNDLYIVDNTRDTVTELASEGTDTVWAAVTFTLSNHVEHLTLTSTRHINGTGNSLRNFIQGNEGNNTLTGLGGNDTLSGGLGSDSYVFSQNHGVDIIQDDGGDDDRVLIAFTSNTLGLDYTKVAFFLNGSDLQFGYVGTQDVITVQSQTDSDRAIERFDVAGGRYLTASGVQDVLDQMTSYASGQGISLNSLADVKANTELMSLIAAAWQTV